MYYCIDDFGLNDDSDHLIVKLCKMRKVNIVSVIVNYRDINNDLISELISLRDKTDLKIFLHLNLTEGQNRILKSRKSFLWGFIFRKEIEVAISDQLHSFKEIFGFSPDGVDGHEHVHQLPYVNDILISYMTDYKINFLRTTCMNYRFLFSSKHILKFLILDLLGKYSRNKLKSSSIRTNASFSGVYDFINSDINELKRQLEFVEENDMIMMHPGTSYDPRYGSARNLEFKLLLNNLKVF